MLVLMLVMQCNPRCIESETNVTSLANKPLQENIAVARSASASVAERARPAGLERLHLIH
jgi:hypothetical protein